MTKTTMNFAIIRDGKQVKEYLSSLEHCTSLCLVLLREKPESILMVKMLRMFSLHAGITIYSRVAVIKTIQHWITKVGINYLNISMAL